MRTVIFCLLLTTGCSTFAASQELRANAQKSPQNAKTVEQQTAQGQQSAMNQPHGRSHPLPLPKDEIHRATPNTTQARSAGVTKSANIASAGLSKTQATSNLRSVQLHAAPRSPQSPSNMHHRSPNPAILGGSAKPTASGMSARNGTQVSRRP
jgi:hypothetical protein